MVKCSKCANEVHPLAVFPSGLCVDCYAQTPEANRPITARELAQMWGGKQSFALAEKDPISADCPPISAGGNWETSAAKPVIPGKKERARETFPNLCQTNLHTRKRERASDDQFHHYSFIYESIGSVGNYLLSTRF